jgi:hypothetical protein
MRSYLLGAAAALGLFPVMASAVVQINVDRLDGVIPTAAQQTVYVDVFGVDMDNTDERLNTYTISVNGVGFSGTGNAPRFSFPAGGTGSLGSIVRPSAAHPFVFGGLDTIPPIESFGSNAGRLQFASNTVEQTDEVNLSALRNGFIRLPVIIPANATPGTYPLVVDLSGTQLAGLGAPVVATLGTQGSVTIVPEPASLGLIVLGGLLTLRRRRVA